jgi:hypothetical protein
MQHASSGALDRLEPLLEELRGLPQLAERRRGVFYKKSKAFIHFHEDPSGLHADVRLGDAFERVRVETRASKRRCSTEFASRCPRVPLSDDG